MTLTEKADTLAARAHEGQMRKEAPVPYIEHPRAVADILRRHGFSDIVIAAALVHDVPEDTKMTLEDIRRELGEEVAAIVTPVTQDDSLSWKDKKRAYVEAVRHSPVEAKAVATADKIHNAQSTLAAHAKQGPAYWGHFKAGRYNKLWFEEEMLKMLRETWQHPLVDEYAELVERMKRLA